MGDWGGEKVREEGLVSIPDRDQRLEEKIGVVGLEAWDAEDGLDLVDLVDLMDLADLVETSDSVRVKIIRLSEVVVVVGMLEGGLHGNNSSSSCGGGSVGLSLDTEPYFEIQLRRRMRILEFSSIPGKDSNRWGGGVVAGDSKENGAYL